MARLFPMTAATRMEIPFRRALALDAGSRCLKLTWVEVLFGRLRILNEQSIDLQEEGLRSATELDIHLHAVLKELGHPPIAFTLPQPLSTSQLIDLPPVPEEEARRLIEEEAVKLSGVSDTAIIYDSVRIHALAQNRQQYWVTLCQEGEIREQLKRLDLDQEELCEVTTTANALIAAYLAMHPEADQTVLVHTGAQNTVVVILVNGHGVYAGTFPMGGDFFTRAIARQLNCSLEAAEQYKRTKDVFTGDDALPDFGPVVDGWVEQLKRQLDDWFGSKTGRDYSLSAFQVVVGGGAFMQPGLLHCLKEKIGVACSRWPVGGGKDSALPTAGFEVAYGTALQALGRSAQPASLLPVEYRVAGRRRRLRQWIEFANVALLIFLGLLLLFGTWQKWSLVKHKEALRAKMRAGLENTQKADVLTAQLLTQYEQLRPLLERQKNTLDTLRTLALLQQSRSNRSYWYVLFADQQSYFTQPLATAPTNVVAVTNPPPVGTTELLAGAATNPPPAKPGFIAELCVPEDADSARKTFSQLVDNLKRDALFSKVDSLSTDLRRSLADPSLVLTNRHFALAFELADTELQRPIPARRRLPSASLTNLISRPPARTPRVEPQIAESLTPSNAP